MTQEELEQYLINKNYFKEKKMLSKEENKTTGFDLNVIKNYIEYMKSIIQTDICLEIDSKQTKEFYVCLNKLVKENENQQKEIDELKTKLEIEKIDNKYNQEERDEETIPRYQIREKIKEFENKKWSYTKLEDIKQIEDKIKTLKELLEENTNE